MDPRSVFRIDTWRRHTLLGDKKTRAGAYQGCNVLKERGIFVVGPEEEVLASRGQHAQQQGSEHDRIQWKVRGCRVDARKERGIETVGDLVSARSVHYFPGTGGAH